MSKIFDLLKKQKRSKKTEKEVLQKQLDNTIQEKNNLTDKIKALKDRLKLV